MTDQHRMDYVSYAGNAKIRTPNIDRIAEIVGFTCCQTVNPVCMPARSEINWCRLKRDFIIDNTPLAQTCWAPLMK